MTPGQVFLLVLFALYLSDCFLLVPRRGFAFLSIFRRSRWRVALPGQALGNDRAGLVMANPFPTLGRAFATGLWPISLTPEGFTGLVTSTVNPGQRPPLFAGFTRWEDLKQVGWDGRFLLANGKRVLKMHSPEIAREYAALLLKLAKLPAGDRAAAISRWCRRGTSAKYIRRKLRVFERATAGLRHSCNLLFLIVFAAVPLTYWYFGAQRPFFVTLAVMGLLMIMIGIEFWCIHMRFYPRQRAERFQLWMLVGFMPQYSIRAIDELSKGFLQNAHPLAVAEAVLDDARFRTFRDAILRDLAFPVPHFLPEDGMGDALAAAESFREKFERPVLQGTARRRLAEQVRSMPDPEESDEGAAKFCPRCLMTYGGDAGTCADCGGVKILPLAG